MKEIKRYSSNEIYYVAHEDYDGNTMDNIEATKDGEWVRFIDHKAVVETMQKRIDELDQEVEKYRYRLGLRSTYTPEEEHIPHKKLLVGTSCDPGIITGYEKRIDDLEDNMKEFCDLLVNRYDYSDRESDEITERAESVITKFDN